MLLWRGDIEEEIQYQTEKKKQKTKKRAKFEVEVNLVYLSDSEKAIVAEIMRMKMGFYIIQLKRNGTRASTVCSNLIRISDIVL